MAKRKQTPVQPSVQIAIDPNNANRHDESSLAAVRESVKLLGAGRSIVVDRNGKVIGGEATLKAAQELGLELQQVKTTGDKLIVVVREDLDSDDPRRVALAIADNKTAKLSDFDYQVLAEQLRAIGEVDSALLAATAFNAHELQPLLNATWSRPDQSDLPTEDGTEGDEPGVEMGRPLKLTADQRGIVDQAIAAVRTREGADVSEGRAIELICADFLAGPGNG